ncbi:MAG TPA: hypothetical protein VHA71_00005, partial [Rhodanobacteraceae bacterium]|nr:hypothetical protein [Rhodanobacteraceae bacterium]
WNAIPDIGMPDEAHMAPGSAVESVAVEPAASDVPSPGVPASQLVDAPVHAWSVPAASGAMRPSIGSGMQGVLHAGAAPLVVHVNKPQAGTAAAEATDRDEAAPSPESKG